MESITSDHQGRVLKELLWFHICGSQYILADMVPIPNPLLPYLSLPSKQ